MKTIYIDLVLDNGELVQIECPMKFESKLHDSLENHIKRADQWSPGEFDECSATFLGMHLGLVNMARVVGVL